MLDTSLLNLARLARIQLFANIPWYVFKYFRGDETVKALADRSEPIDLVAEIVRIDGLPNPTLEELTVATAALVALSFHGLSEVSAVLPALGGITKIRWIDELLGFVKAFQASSNVVHMRGKPRIVGAQDQAHGAASGPILNWSGGRK